MKNPTMKFAEYATKVYETYNRELWGGQLPHCLITLQRHRNARGYFAAKRFADSNKVSVHEIALNPETFERDIRDITSTLVHEMAHLWQEEFGKSSRNGYHNRQWAEEMLRIGLEPVSLDNPGKMTGQRVTHTIMADGEFARVWDSLKDELDSDALLRDIWQSVKKPTKNSKVRYDCPVCGAKAWAKPDSNLMCGDCQEVMPPQ